MLWSWGLLQLLFVFSFGYCQQVQDIKLKEIREVLELVRTFESKFQVLQNMIEKLTDTNEGLDDRMTSLDDSMASLDNKMALQDDRMASQNDRMASLDDRMASQDNRMVSLDGKMASQDNKLARLDERMNTLEGQFCDLEQQEPSKLDQIYQKIADIFGEFDLQREMITNSCNIGNQVESLQTLLATDECQDGLHNCSSNARCTDAVVGFRCSCKEGYQGDGVICEDIDECVAGVSNDCNMHAHCNNKEGGHQCSCFSGFTGDGTICDDVNECQSDIHGCHANAECQNHVGNFSCVCREGFIGDGVTCEGSFKCESPFVAIEQLGCITQVMTPRIWEECRTNCLSLGGNLLEGITSQHQLNQLKGHFPRYNPFIGLRKLKWVTRGDSLDADSPLWRGGQSHRGGLECAGACLSLSCSTPSLVDASCSRPRSSLCQKH